MTSNTAAIMFVTVDGLPDAYRNGEDLEITITGYHGPVEATIVVPLVDARRWIAELHLAIDEALNTHPVAFNPSA